MQGRSELALGGVTLEEIPGNHYTILRKPRIEVLAQQPRSCLERGQRSFYYGA